MKNNQQGFGLVEIIIAVVLVALVGGTGYIVWKKNSDGPVKKSRQTAAEANPRETAKSPAGTPKEKQVLYLALTDYKVRVPLDAKTQNLKAGSPEPSSYDEYDFEGSVTILAPELDASWTCLADGQGHKGTIGKISITKGEQRSGPYAPAASKKIGEYTYGFEPGGSNCTSSPAHHELTAAFKARFASMEAY